MDSKGTYSITIQERKNHMSFNLSYLTPYCAYLGADSRRSFENGKYEDNFQKVFTNQELKMIWSMTGTISYQYINYINVVNSILNQKEANIYSKLKSIEVIMNAITKLQYIDYYLKKDFIFDLFIITIENGQLTHFTFESKNGYTTPGTGNMKYTGNHREASGIHTEYIRSFYLSEDRYALENIGKIMDLIQYIIEIDKKEEISTVGGDIYIATMDINGNIHTYINGKETPFL